MKKKKKKNADEVPLPTYVVQSHDEKRNHEATFMKSVSTSTAAES